ncbi:hypothetical protein [Georgenia sp. SUBG003]|uniref:hypothetical protein n=1 Tax=Georgenia sp. SUBG003 TaxID=1497974 RepID=UPI003AB6EEF6
MSKANVAQIAGDGIGVEVMDSARAVLDVLLPLTGDTIVWTELDWSCERYRKRGAMMPADGMLLAEQLAHQRFVRPRSLSY